MSQIQLSDSVYFDIALRLVASLVIGGLIGLERSYHGRPAGFRTHSLVCLSTSLLMLVTVYETRWFPSLSEGRISLDPTRMAQGIMTGIGFLGAGTIMKDGLSVRGLTTAASIWITAAIGHSDRHRFLRSRGHRDGAHSGYALGVPMDRKPNSDAVIRTTLGAIPAQRSDVRHRNAALADGSRFHGRQSDVPA